MRIVIDLQAAQSPGSRIRGIGRYSLALAEAMARNAGDHEVWIALNHEIPDVIAPIRERFAPWLPAERVVVWESLPGTAAIDPSNLPARRVAETLRDRFLASLAPDVVHTSSLFEGMTDAVVASVPKQRGDILHTVSLYDLIPYVRRDVYLQDPRARDWYLDKTESLLRADLLLGISDYTCREAIEHLAIDPAKVANVSAGLGEEFYVLDDAERARAAASLRVRFGLGERFVIHTGGFDARKNLDGLVRAFAQVPSSVRKGVQLVLVGHGPPQVVDPLLAMAAELGLGKQDVLYTDYVDDADLRALYNLSALHVFPTFHEGFGLPALEAMACGAPVIGSNTTSLPEVIGLPEAMFDPNSTADIAAHIERGLVDEAFCARLREHARVQVAKFDWDDSAKRALRAMESLHAARRTRPPAAAPAPDAALRALAETACEAIPDAATFEAVKPALATAMALNVKPARPQLLVDVTVLSALDIGTGIQRVVRNIAQDLLAHGHPRFDVRPVRFEHGTGYLHANAFAARVRGTEPAEADLPIAAWPGDVLLGLDLIAHIVPLERAHFEWLRRRGVQIWFVVYDMLPVLFPHYFREEVKAPFVPWYETIGELATGLACISASVANEVGDWYDRTQPRRAYPLTLAHFHLGADLDRGQAAPVREAKVPGAPKTFLMVGTIEPRKGHRLVLDAFEKLWAQGEDARLVVLGKPGWLVDDVIARLREHGAEPSRLVWHENADDALLGASYAQADALIMASEGEGFGLPLIEAAQHGLPLIARDLPVFREIAGDAAHYFRGEDGAEGLAHAVRAWMQAHDAGRHPRPEDLRWLTWEQSTQQLLDVIEHPSRFTAWRAGARYVIGPDQPRTHVRQGDYAVEIVLRSPRDAVRRAVVELASTNGRMPPHRIDLAHADIGADIVENALTLRFPLHVPRDIDDFEVRVHAPAGDATEFVLCTLTRAAGSPARPESRPQGIKDSIDV